MEYYTDRSGKVTSLFELRGMANICKTLRRSTTASKGRDELFLSEFKDVEDGGWHME